MNTKARRFAHRGSPRKSDASTRRFAVAVGVLALLTTTAGAQEVFRSSRPNYTRNQFRANTSDRSGLGDGGNTWVPRSQLRAPSPVGQVGRFEPVGDFETLPPRLNRVSEQEVVPASRSDFERVRSAWENYRREAIRYQARYGDSEFAANPFGSTAASLGQTAASLGQRDTLPRGVASTPWRPIEDDRVPPEYSDRNRLPLARNASLRPNVSQLTRRDFGCRGGADQRPRLNRDVPVVPYREDANVDFDDGLLPPVPGFRDNAADSRPVLRPSTSGSLRRNFPPNAPFQEDLRSERYRDTETRDIPSPYTRSRSDVNRANGRLFSTPAPKFDPAKLASRASNFFRTNLSE